MEKEAKMPVTADQRPLWNTQRRPEDSSPRSTARTREPMLWT